VWSELQADFDYAPLRDALAAGEFQEADDITRAALIQLAGPGAVKRNWVYFTGDPAGTSYVAVFAPFEYNDISGVARYESVDFTVTDANLTRQQSSRLCVRWGLRPP